jgi:large subunit ribosomal protein L32e
MADKKRLLAIRKKLKQRTPNFNAVKNHTKIRLKLKPRWRHSWNKQKKHKVGRAVTVRVGFKGPAGVRGLSRNGFEQVIVSSPDAIKRLTVEQGAVIGSTVGTKKKIEMVEYAIKNNIQILNIKDVKSFVEKAKGEFDKRVADKKKYKEETKKRIEKKQEKSAEKKEASDAKAEPEKKTEEKKEHDKILTTG